MGGCIVSDFQAVVRPIPKDRYDPFAVLEMVEEWERHDADPNRRPRRADRDRAESNRLGVGLGSMKAGCGRVKAAAPGREQGGAPDAISSIPRPLGGTRRL